MFKIISMFCALVFTVGATAQGGQLSAKTLDWYAKFSSRGGLPTVMPEAAGFFDESNAIFMGSAQTRKVYLTFDAGYENGCTARILDVLAENGIQAAFFLDGNYLRRNPELTARMAAEGHLVCNHTLKHPDMTKLTDFNLYKQQIEEWEKLCGTIGVSHAKLYRPPMGKFSRLSLSYDSKLGYRTVFWSIAYADWDQKRQPTAADALSLLTSKAHNGAIYLLHSISTTNAQILPELIDRLRADGYAIAPASELL